MMDLPRDDLSPKDIWQCLEIVRIDRSILLVSIRKRPEMVLNILYFRVDPYPKELSGPNVSSAKTEKPSFVLYP
jgi:hypothetical protein